ncbi:ribosomal RNA small subunit methyltransferase A [Thermodesulfobacterium sp. TA1]|uniref:16S rRNA (adenine(1518)-N(6)/adenine(1519)-N(6))- dimethyltransferase RsmA n=1 Tax=Thermodesulfobacterium sp. TA1 TaxID=2234087 RepID=UPI001231DFB1|nr:16S rRNA (adenine(1518)-N(6)/adenine(1519)-N(6))-dimethyltransferase RsmA [Thermodesulfobacterium sp. TA1]QER41414.1 ribosomal RNA small subunit methyltransferase A [Thermodesulfobacterium sp. TA1]
MLKKKWGQHLLVSSGVLERLVELAEIKEEETVVEIGPGTGNLTKKLLSTSLKRLYLIEIDSDMITRLKNNINDPRVVIFNADATRFDFDTLGEKELKLIGNLPYNVASLIIENTVYHKHLVYQAFYMVQKEVAERLIYLKSWLSIFVNTFYQVEYLMSIPPKFFIPPPKVNSAYLRFIRKDFEEIKDLKYYKNFLVKLFSQKRKMLKHKIAPEFLERASISPEKRVEQLSLSDFIALYRSFSQ